MHPFLSLEHPIRLAHRGSRILWPENTVPAFQGAVDLGYRYIETDVRMTRDGVVVVFHDATLNRTTDATGPIADWYWDDLRKADAGWSFGESEDFPYRGKGVSIPSLQQVLEGFPDTRFNLDLKAPGIEWAVADVAKRLRATDRILVGGFHDRRMAKFRRISHGEIATSAGPADSIAMWTASRLGRSVPRPVDAYQLPRAMAGMTVDAKLIDAVHRVGKQIHVWTINEAAQMNELLDLGVDGIVTDRPDVLNDVLRERGHDV